MRYLVLMIFAISTLILSCTSTPEPTPHEDDEHGAADESMESMEEMEHTGEEHQHGEVDFPVSCDEEAQEMIELGLAHLHHMMYDQARPHFEAAVQADSECAMAHWGVAMTCFQPLWAPSSDDDMELGKTSVQKALEIGAPTERERGYLGAVEAFFSDPDPPAADRPADFEARVKAWKSAQRQLHEADPDDVDAGAFYALSEVAYAMTQFSPDTERDYSREILAGELLEDYFETHQEHPGLFHYLIHAYDSSELAPRALEVAREYDQLAPDVPHALHMPSHIFVRLGKWEETIDWNVRSAEAALENPFNGMTSLHYPHALDYMMYGYLQIGDEESARQTLEAVRQIEQAQPHFGSAYGIAAPQARYYLEQQRWEEAASLESNHPDAVQWEDYPAAAALFHYARGIGAARSDDLDGADAEVERIEELVHSLDEAGNRYWSSMTDALGQAVAAWVTYARGDVEEALTMMSDAADQEDAMDKHPITPGEVLPVRELYAEMLLLEGRTDEARAALEDSLQRTPNRRNALDGMSQLEETVSTP